MFEKMGVLGSFTLQLMPTAFSLHPQQYCCPIAICLLSQSSVEQEREMSIYNHEGVRCNRRSTRQGISIMGSRAGGVAAAGSSFETSHMSHLC